MALFVTDLSIIQYVLNEIINTFMYAEVVGTGFIFLSIMVQCLTYTQKNQYSITTLVEYIEPILDIISSHSENLFHILQLPFRMVNLGSKMRV